MAHPKDRALAAIVEAIDSLFLHSRAFPGHEDADRAWRIVHRDEPDYTEALAAARAAQAKDSRWGAFRATVESAQLTSVLPAFPFEE